MMKSILVTVCTIIQITLYIDPIFSLNNNNIQGNLDEIRNQMFSFRIENGIRVAVQSENASSLEDVNTDEIIAIDGNGNRANPHVMSNPCGQSDGGGDTAIFKSADFDACTLSDCNIIINKIYNGVLTFKPQQNETELVMNISVVSLSPNNPRHQLIKSIKTFQNYTANLEQTFQFTEVQFSDDLVNKSEIYLLELKLYSSDNKIVLCRTIPITLDATQIFANDNDGDSYGAPCTNLNMPCAFENSQCLQVGSKLQCQCAVSTYYESKRGCKKTIGTICEESEECIKNAECQRTTTFKGFCNCKNGYLQEGTDLRFCNDAPNVINLSIYLLISLQITLCLRSML